MRRFLVILIMLVCINLSAQNGSIEFNEGQEILNLWGSSYEMGYAHGYLLNQRIIDFYMDFLFNGLGMTVPEYNYIHSTFWSDFTIEQRYIDEANAMLDGISASGTSLYSDTLGRELDSTDVMIANSIVDVSYLYYGKQQGFGCSSLSAWGEATMTDSILQGDVIMGRNLDFTSTECMLDNAIIFVCDPTGYSDWVGFAYPGMISVISGINEEMLVAEMNMGYHTSTPDLSCMFTPFQFTLRTALEISDYDTNAVSDYMDVLSVCRDNPNTGSWLCHTISPYTDSLTICAAVIECVNETGDTVRFSNDDPDLAPYHLLMLNHEEVNYIPYNDARHDEIVDSVKANSNTTADRMWELMNCISRASTIQTMFFLPNDSIFGIAFTDSINTSANKAPVYYHWLDVFPNHDLSGIDKEQGDTEMYLLKDFSGVKGRIFDITGREVDPDEQLPDGVYLILKGEFKKALLIR